MTALERARIMLEAKDRHSDDISRDVELAGLEKEQILGDQAGVAMATQVGCLVGCVLCLIAHSCEFSWESCHKHWMYKARCTVSSTGAMCCASWA
jgi:tetrahydromethanopterin S-methyltransferase subunit G